jgi:ATP-dependent Clp protease ATP-binding subunit ClpA
MAAVPSRIEELARDTAQIADPDTALRALTALRRELDTTEPELVQRALQAGASWSQIARALGITKQAAHRKHRHVFDQTFGAPEDKGKLPVTRQARDAIQFARQEANRLGQPAVGTEHILLGILRCRESHAAHALGALGVTLEAARGCLQTTLPGVPPDATLPGRPARPEVASAHARRIIEGSLREAVNRGEDHVGVEHLLLALLADSRNGAVQTLEALKISPAQIRRQLEHEFATFNPVVDASAHSAAVAEGAEGPAAGAASQSTSRSRPVSTS